MLSNRFFYTFLTFLFFSFFLLYRNSNSKKALKLRNLTVYKVGGNVESNPLDLQISAIVDKLLQSTKLTINFTETVLFLSSKS